MRQLLLILLPCMGLLLLGTVGGCPTNGLPGSIGDLAPDDGADNDSGTADDDTATQKTRHEKIFTEIVTGGFQSTQDCMNCHSDKARQLLENAHWKWEGVTNNIVGHEGEVHGKMDLINNFCVAVPSNEGRCSQCHPSYGWKSKNFDFSSTDNVDCLVCHDTTGTYKKHPTAGGGGGQPAMSVDGELTVVGAEMLQQVAYNVGKPSRGNCGACHFYAGGGDNVKVGTLSSNMTNPTYQMDVHMGSTATGGQDFTCQQCHGTINHGIAGMVLHSENEGGPAPNCTRCHGERPHAADPLLASLLNIHCQRVACETCHIPTFSRSMPTKVEWYWDEAGQDINPIPTDQYGKPTYDKKKGRFVWAQNVTPKLMWYNDKWQRKIIGVADTYTEAGTAADPIVIAKPTATINDTNAKIYPFKQMLGRQPVDPVNQRLLVPHLFPGAAGENAFWKKFQWGPALAEGAAYAGQEYSGTYDFANTVMYLRVSHEVAPASQAMICDDCHGVPGFFESLGYAEDPFGAN